MRDTNTYMNSVHRDGRVWNIGMMLLLILFPVSVAFL